jgi:hypothetical protein
MFAVLLDAMKNSPPVQCDQSEFWWQNMRSLHATHAAALRDAFRHAVERDGMPLPDRLHQGLPSPSALAQVFVWDDAMRVTLDHFAPLRREEVQGRAKPRSKCGAVGD